jgi:NifU-like protein
MHCSVMGEEALRSAIADFRGEKIEPHDEGEVVCQCFGVTDKEIERVAKANDLHTLEEITNYTKAGGGCESCHEDIQAILDRIWAEDGAKPLVEVKPPAKKKLTIYKR